MSLRYSAHTRMLRLLASSMCIGQVGSSMQPTSPRRPNYWLLVRSYINGSDIRATTYVDTYIRVLTIPDI